MKKTYYEKLKDPRWQKKRLEIMQRDDFTCRICSSNKKSLNVHHTKYIFGNEPWEYAKKDLVTLCEECHEKLTEVCDITKFIMSEHILLTKHYNLFQLILETFWISEDALIELTKLACSLQKGNEHSEKNIR